MKLRLLALTRLVSKPRFLFLREESFLVKKEEEEESNSPLAFVPRLVTT